LNQPGPHRADHVAPHLGLGVGHVLLRRRSLEIEREDAEFAFSAAFVERWGGLPVRGAGPSCHNRRGRKTARKRGKILCWTRFPSNLAVFRPMAQWVRPVLHAGILRVLPKCPSSAPGPWPGLEKSTAPRRRFARYISGPARGGITKPSSDQRLRSEGTLYSDRPEGLTVLAVAIVQRQSRRAPIPPWSYSEPFPALIRVNGDPGSSRWHERSLGVQSFSRPFLLSSVLLSLYRYVHAGRERQAFRTRY